MAKLVTVPITNATTISGVNTINSNFDAVETAMENTLSRDGTSPNQMNADIDLNSNDLLNVGNIQANDIIVDGSSVNGILDRAETAVEQAEAAAQAAEEAAASAGVPDGDKGDVIVSNSGTNWVLNAGSVVADTITSVASGIAAIAFKLGIQTNGDYTVYVATTGSDITGDGTIGNPYATPQKAWDSLPWLIKDKVVISIANGTYNTSSRPAATLDRPALLYLDKKKLGRRTDAPGGVMTGSVVFMGESEAGVIFQPGNSNGYIRGIYVTAHTGSVGFQNFTIDAQTGAESGIVAHRGSYIHASNITINGNSILTYGIIGEATGFLEGLNIEIHHTAYGVQCYASSTVQLSLSSYIHDCSSFGINIPNGGYVGLTSGSICASAILLAAGAKLDLTGASNSRVLISGSLQVRGGDVTMTYVDLTGSITTYPGSRINAGAMGWSNQWTDYGAEIYMPGCKSWVSPATKSAVVTPLFFNGEARRLYVDTTFQIINSSGAEVAENIGFGSSVSIGSDGIAISDAVIKRDMNFVNLTTIATRTNITLPSGMNGRSDNAPIPAGTVLHVINSSTFGITLAPGSVANFANASTYEIGTSTGMYMGVVAVMSVSGLWYVYPMGDVRP